MKLHPTICIAIVALMVGACRGQPSPASEDDAGTLGAGAPAPVGSANGDDSGPGPVDSSVSASTDAGVPADSGSPSARNGGGSGDAATAAASVCGVPGACVAAGKRDPSVWPFDACSPWNHPIGDGAVFASVTAPGPVTAGGVGWMTYSAYSHPVFVEGTPPGHSGVLFGGNETGQPVSYTLNLPDDATPAVGSDADMHVVDQARQNVYECFEATAVDGGFHASNVILNSLYGTGVYPTWHGARAYGGSALGGLIRPGELLGGIPHALAIAAPEASMNKIGPNGQCYVWPASACDGAGNNGYGTTGNVFMGSLLAIPPGVDLTTMFTSKGITNPRVQSIARALQTYGAYVVDRGGNGMLFYAEPWDTEAGSTLETYTTDTQLSQVIALAQVVTNNDASHIGGGGKPAACFAPPLP